MIFIQNKSKTNLAKLFFISFSAALGGMLFGYDLGVIGGAINPLVEKFGLSPFMEGWTAGCAVIGCILGALIAGVASDKWGRKKLLLAAAFLFIITAIGTAFAQNIAQFATYRILGGFGIGIVSTVVPPYIAETSPARLRGRLVSLYQFTIVIGFLIVSWINLEIASQGDHLWNVNVGWRWMFGAGSFPAVLFLAFILFIPESPRWLLQNNQPEKARAQLECLHGIDQAASEMTEIEGSLSHEDGGMRDLMKPGIRRAMLVGVALMFFQQFSGINAINNFAPSIFQNAGANLHDSLSQTLIMAAVNVVFTIVGIWSVDILGRKALMLIGTIGLAICLATIGFTFSLHISGAWVLIPILVYTAFFAATIGPVVWVIVSEIFPNKSRGLAMSIVVFVMWVSNFINIQVYPVLRDGFGNQWTFWTYSFVMLLMFVFVLKMVPETKNKTLEEIEADWGKTHTGARSL